MAKPILPNLSSEIKSDLLFLTMGLVAEALSNVDVPTQECEQLEIDLAILPWPDKAEPSRMAAIGFILGWRAKQLDR